MDFKIKPTRPIITYCTVAFAGVASYFFFMNFSNFLDILNKVMMVLTPFILGYVLAYILNMPMSHLENELKKVIKGAHRAKLRRIVSVSVIMTLAIGSCTFLIVLLLPQVQTSISVFSNKLPEHIYGIKSSIVQLLAENNIDTSHINEMIRPEQIVSGFMASSAWIVNAVQILFSSIMNAIIAIVLCALFLFNKEVFFAQSRKLMYVMFDKENSDRIMDIMRRSNKTFKSYISGILLNSLIVGVLVTVAMMFIEGSYALLVGGIVGVSNIIPFFGPIIGAVPAGIFIALLAPDKIWWFLIVLLIIQQIDANIIGPKIVGNSVGLPAFWVIFALIVGGGMFGFAGMVLGAPFFSVFYFMFTAYINRKHDVKRATELSGGKGGTV